MTTTELGLGKCSSCKENDAVGVCNVFLAQPVSLPYCGRCLEQGIEGYGVICASVYMLILDAPDYEMDLPDPLTVQSVQQNMAPWAVEIIERSLAFHQKTWDDVLRDAMEDVERFRREHPDA